MVFLGWEWVEYRVFDYFSFPVLLIQTCCLEINSNSLLKKEILLLQLIAHIYREVFYSRWNFLRWKIFSEQLKHSSPKKTQKNLKFGIPDFLMMCIGIPIFFYNKCYSPWYLKENLAWVPVQQWHIQVSCFLTELGVSAESELGYSLADLLYKL